jgi:SAM-dependent methyltransferase
VNFKQAYPADLFDRIFSALATSQVYREAMQAADPDLPDWLAPYSTITFKDLTRIASLLKVGPGDTFVDLACGLGGPGIWVAEHTGAALVGVDFSAAAVKAAQTLAQQRPLPSPTRFVVAHAVATGLDDAFAKGVMSIDALMFIDSSAIDEIARIIKPGGTAVIRAAETLGDPHLPTLVPDYRPIFEAAGFTIEVREEVPDFEASSPRRRPPPGDRPTCRRTDH